MTTVINNPGNNDGSDSSVGLIIGVIILLAMIGLFIIYGLPAIRNGAIPTPQNGSMDINVKLPTEIPSPAPTK